MKRFIALLLNAVTVMAFIGTPSQAQWVEQPIVGQFYGWDIYFLNPQYGWASGQGHGLSRTRDGGVTWQALYSPVPSGGANFDAVCALDTNTVIAAGSASSGIAPIIRSTDGGQTWVQISHPASAAVWNDLEVLPNGTIIAAGGSSRCPTSTTFTMLMFALVLYGFLVTAERYFAPLMMVTRGLT